MDDSDTRTESNFRDNYYGHGGAIRPSKAQLRYLCSALERPGGKLPIFDKNGRRIDPNTIRSCINHGWAEPWIGNATKPDWLVCRLTPAGRRAANAN